MKDNSLKTCNHLELLTEIENRIKNGEIQVSISRDDKSTLLALKSEGDEKGLIVGIDERGEEPTVQCEIKSFKYPFED